MQPEEASAVAGGASNTPPFYDKETYIAATVLGVMPDWITGTASIETHHLRHALDYLGVGDERQEHKGDVPFQLAAPYLFTYKWRPLRTQLLVVHCDKYLDVRVEQHGSSLRVAMTIYSRLLWELGLHALPILDALALDLFGCVFDLLPSRVDICADVVGFDLRSIDTNRLRDSFLTHAQSLDVQDSALPDHARCKTVRGRTIYIGGEKSAASLKLYEKSAELATSGKDYYQPVWLRAGWDGASPIVRIEFKLSRQYLKTIVLGDGRALTSLSQLPDCLMALWRNALATTRMVVPSDVSNRSRMETAPLWVALRDARCMVDHVSHNGSVDRLSGRRPERAALEAQLVGVAVTVAALMPGGDEATSQTLARYIEGLFCRVERDKGPLGAQVLGRRLDRMWAAG